VLQRSFNRLVDQIRRSIEFRFTIGIIDNVVAKYLALLVGYFAVSRPYLTTDPSPIDDLDTSDRMEHYYSSGRLLVSLASAVGRIVLAGRELTRLAAFSSRVSDLLDKVRDCH
jgi:ATP-binding cassette subfamily D (ALD) protein 3